MPEDSPPAGDRPVAAPPRPAAAPHVSPSLSGSADASTPAYEVKFLLAEEQAAEVEARLRDHLALDPHADPARGNSYLVTSVYYDTPRFDVYCRTEGFRNQKYRLRRYGDAPMVFLERKSKRGKRVWKQRAEVPLGEVATVLSAEPAVGRPGDWFVRELAEQQLGPVCRVTYERVAYCGRDGDGGNIRVTMDRAARGLLSADPVAEPFADGLPLLTDEVIVEFKFLAAMPALFKGVVAALKLTPGGVSKYRRCAQAAGLMAERGDRA